MSETKNSFDPHAMSVDTGIPIEKIKNALGIHIPTTTPEEATAAYNRAPSDSEPEEAEAAYNSAPSGSEAERLAMEKWNELSKKEVESATTP
ncbi:MAG: hypothetical protein HGB03_02170, partial [Candidatus Yonathbacteria bacterium]|nr:hypothetical protein [Candidatus Yonathbacteria bacterium]